MKKSNLELMKKVRKLRQKKTESEIANDFLKNCVILCKENRIETYHFIDNYKEK